MSYFKMCVKFFCEHEQQLYFKAFLIKLDWKNDFKRPRRGNLTSASSFTYAPAVRATTQRFPCWIASENSTIWLFSSNAHDEKVDTVRGNPYIISLVTMFEWLLIYFHLAVILASRTPDEGTRKKIIQADATVWRRYSII